MEKQHIIIKDSVSEDLVFGPRTERNNRLNINISSIEIIGLIEIEELILNEGTEIKRPWRKFLVTCLFAYLHKR